eukprot:TRINITY_DN419_c0_g2_i1.p1 TRINITY_DN419_c0_g2~~TRINITY_DN419_c0_g2_i1.p1  ORF type:complete len:163 (-),score=10.33 TRINITY_DN419_c0_g2_i1:147-635(-)
MATADKDASSSTPQRQSLYQAMQAKEQLIKIFVVNFSWHTGSFMIYTQQLGQGSQIATPRLCAVTNVGLCLLMLYWSWKHQPFFNPGLLMLLLLFSLVGASDALWISEALGNWWKGGPSASWSCVFAADLAMVWTWYLTSFATASRAKALQAQSKATRGQGV